MKLNIDNNFCDLCLSKLYNPYEPINTKRFIYTFQCNKCFLLQSLPQKKYKSNSPASMSFDADRSSIMYTKKLVLPIHLKFFKRFKINFLNFQTVLDIGSNRGDFLNHFFKQNKSAIIYAIEPKQIFKKYKKNKRLKVVNLRYENFNTDKKFDFIYCVHTLEHLESCLDALKKMKMQLSSLGKIFLSVPNINHSTKKIFEEIFIDNHTFHLTNNVMIKYFNLVGLKILKKDIRGNELQYLLTKKNNVNNSIHLNKSLDLFDKKNSLAIYKKRISYNRNALKLKCRKIKSLLEDGNKILFWGAGRIFDGLIKIGNIKPTPNIRVLDKNLHKFFKKLHGFKLINTSNLKYTEKQTILIVCSRFYAKEILIEAKKFKFKKTVIID